MSQIVLQTADLSIGYKRPRQPDRIVAGNLNLTLFAGEMVCLLGPNGAGKSTLMRTIAGMQPALGGKITLLGDDLSRLGGQDLARRLSLVLTERVDVGMMSAYDLVTLGRYPYTDWAGRLTADDDRIVEWAIEVTGAQALAQRFFHELSDGERQKILIARALAQEPALMLLDEPTAFLDLPRRVEIMRTLRKLARETGRAVLLSTHDLDLALRSADRLWLLAMNGVMHVGAPEDLVLNGAFEAAFHSEGVEFDIETGAFRVNPGKIWQVNFQGEGIHALWTRRALEREGFAITENPTPLQIQLIDANSAIKWILAKTGVKSEHHSLEELMKALREKLHE